MSSQAGKAALAALAALFILLALATSSWWSGNLAGSGRRSASIGLLGGVGCNKIGEQTCQSISLSKASSGFAVLGVATFGFGTLAMVGCLALGWLGWKQDPRQRKLAPLTLGVAAAGVLVAIGFILTKPKFIAVPVSYGLVLGLLGFALAAGRAVLGLNASSANAGLYHQAGLQQGYAAAPNPTFDPSNPMGSMAGGYGAAPQNAALSQHQQPFGQHPYSAYPVNQGQVPLQAVPYGAPQGQFGAPPQFGAPSASQPPFGAPPQFGAPSASQPPFGAPPQFGAPPSQPPFGAPPQFGATSTSQPPFHAPPQFVAPPQFGAPSASQPPFHAPPQFGAPAASQPPFHAPPQFGAPLPASFTPPVITPVITPVAAPAAPQAANGPGNPRTVIPVPALGSTASVGALPSPVTRSKPDLTRPPPRRSPAPSVAPPPVPPTITTAKVAAKPATPPPPSLATIPSAFEPSTALDVPAIDKPDFATVAMAPYVDDDAPSPTTLRPDDAEHTQASTPYNEDNENTVAGSMDRPPAPACPTCVSPMEWVAVHGRFFCQVCRAYY